MRFAEVQLASCRVFVFGPGCFRNVSPRFELLGLWPHGNCGQKNIEVMASWPCWRIADPTGRLGEEYFRYPSDDIFFFAVAKDGPRMLKA